MPLSVYGKGRLTFPLICDTSLSERDSLTYSGNIIGPDASQEDAFIAIGGHVIISNFLEGKSATVMAYGGSGSGKSHTLMNTRNSPGLAVMFLEKLFSLTPFSNSIHISLTEIYEKQVYDLLTTDKSVITFPAQASKGEVGIALKICSMKEGVDILSQGLEHRRKRATAINLASSRSHVIFSIINRDNKHQSACLKIVDLAGSENVNLSRVSGHALREASSVNVSLSSLTSVVAALNQRRTHVPYRDNFLCRVLRPSLSTSYDATLIATINLDPKFTTSSKQTLRFAKSMQRIRKYTDMEMDEDDTEVSHSGRGASHLGDTLPLEISGLLSEEKFNTKIGELIGEISSLQDQINAMVQDNEAVRELTKCGSEGSEELKGWSSVSQEHEELRLVTRQLKKTRDELHQMEGSRHRMSETQEMQAKTIEILEKSLQDQQCHLDSVATRNSFIENDIESLNVKLSEGEEHRKCLGECLDRQCAEIEIMKKRIGDLETKSNSLSDVMQKMQENSWLTQYRGGRDKKLLQWHNLWNEIWMLRHHLLVGDTIKVQWVCDVCRKITSFLDDAEIQKTHFFADVVQASLPLIVAILQGYLDQQDSSLSSCAVLCLQMTSSLASEHRLFEAVFFENDAMTNLVTHLVKAANGEVRMEALRLFESFLSRSTNSERFDAHICQSIISSTSKKLKNGTLDSEFGLSCQVLSGLFLSSPNTMSQVSIGAEFLSQLQEGLVLLASGAADPSLYQSALNCLQLLDSFKTLHCFDL